MIGRVLAIFLLSLIGIPLTGGFFGKFYIFKAALDANLIWLDDPRPAELRRGRLLLPARHRRDVHEASRPRPPRTCLRSPRVLNRVSDAGLRPAAPSILGVFPSAVLDFAGSAAQLVK